MRPRAMDDTKHRAGKARTARLVARYAARLGAEEVMRHWLRKAGVLEVGVDADTLAACYGRREIGVMGIGADDSDAIPRLIGGN